MMAVSKFYQIDGNKRDKVFCLIMFILRIIHFFCVYESGFLKDNNMFVFPWMS